MTRKSIIIVIVLAILLLITFFHSYGLSSLFNSSTPFSPDNKSITFVIAFVIVMLCGLPIVHFRIKVKSYIAQNPELTAKYAYALSHKTGTFLLLGWNFFLLYFAFKLSDSEELKQLARKLVIAMLCWVPFIVILFLLASIF